MRQNRFRDTTARLSGVALAAMLSGTAFAQSQAPDEGADKDDEAIVVTANRAGEGINRDLIGSSVTVIASRSLADRETRIVSDVLRDVPGIAVNRTGAVGGLTQIRIRGSESNHVLVFIDGIKASDPYQGEFDFGTLIADDSARVEVLRGQQSSLYGSDAIGGVINYTTLSGAEAPGLRLRAEGGSFGTYNGTARIAGGNETFDYALSGALYHTDGYPTAPGGSRDLGSDNYALSGKVNWAPTETFRMSGVLRYAFTEADTNDQDESATSPIVQGRKIITVIDTPGSFLRNKAFYGLVKAELDSFGDLMTTSISAQIADTSRDAYASYGYNYGDKGVRYRGSLVNALRFGNDRIKHRLTFAMDVEREEFRNAAPTAPDKTTKQLDMIGLVAQYNLVVDDRLSVGGSLRHDINDYFRDPTTWHVEASYLFPTGTRPHAAAGTGIKNPGAFELFGYSTGQYIGNPNLQPERSEGWEIGIDQSLLNGAVTVGATYFNSRLTNEIYIDYLPPDYAGTSLNRTTTTKQQGVEVFGEARLGDIRASLAYTYLDAPQFRNVLLNPTNPTSTATGPIETQAVRRPKNVASFNLTYAPENLPVSGTLTIRYNGKMKDVVYTPSYSALFADVSAFTLVNLSLRYKVTDAIELYGRAENLFDEHYQEVLTFETPGRAIYGGIRARF